MTRAARGAQRHVQRLTPAVRWALEPGILDPAPEPFVAGDPPPHMDGRWAPDMRGSRYGRHSRDIKVPG